MCTPVSLCSFYCLRTYKRTPTARCSNYLLCQSYTGATLNISLHIQIYCCMIFLKIFLKGTIPDPQGFWVRPSFLSILYPLRIPLVSCCPEQQSICSQNLCAKIGIYRRSMYISPPGLMGIFPFLLFSAVILPVCSIKRVLGQAGIPFYLPLLLNSEFCLPPTAPFFIYPSRNSGGIASPSHESAAMMISALMQGCSCWAPIVSASVIRLSFFLTFPSL